MTNSLSSRSSSDPVGTPRRTGAESPLKRSLNSLLPCDSGLRSGVEFVLVLLLVLPFSFGTQDRVRECRVEPDLASEVAPESSLDPIVVGVEGCWFIRPF